MAYGITRDIRRMAKEKIRLAKQFLSSTYVKKSIPKVPIMDDEKVPLIEIVQNSFINTNRYIAEINHRVASIKEYAEQNNLEPLFVTLTLPSQYHPKRCIKLKSGRYVWVRNDNYLPQINSEENTPKLASKHLTALFRRILNHRSYYRIPKDQRLYFRVIEPHKNSGTPHTHALFFVPKEAKVKLVKAIRNLYPEPQSHIVDNIQNATAYMMKYVLKTLDDLRQDEEHYTDLTYWYVYWGICRIYTSRTFPSLEVYRKLKGQFSLLELHHLRKEGRLHCWVNTETEKLDLISIDIEDNQGIYYFNVPLWSKNRYIVVETSKSYEKVPSKWKNKEENRVIPIDTPDGRMYYVGNRVVKPKKIPARMNDLELMAYYRSLDPDDLSISYAKYAVVHNEMVDRDFIDDEMIPLQEAIDLDIDLENKILVEPTYVDEIPF